MNGHGGICCLCGDHYETWGHNPEPLAEFSKGRCCNACNSERVLPVRLESLLKENRGQS